MVQRYDCKGAVVTHEDGPFVLYKDYAALKADRDYWYEKCLDAGLLDEKTDEERAADRKEQDELLDEWYRTEECPYDKR